MGNSGIFFCFQFHNIPPVIYWNDNVNANDASVEKSMKMCFWIKETKEKKPKENIRCYAITIIIIIIIINHTGQSFHGNDNRKQYRTALRKRNLKFSSNQSHPDK